MPWQVMDVMDQRISFIQAVESSQDSFSTLCLRFGISRTTGYKWLDRYRNEGSVNALADRSRRPLHSPGKTPNELENRVCHLRKSMYGMGARKIHKVLELEGVHLGVATVHRILKRHHLVKRRVSHGKTSRRFERERPNQLWQMDFKGPLTGVGPPCHPLSILDDHSRFAVGLHALGNQKGHTTFTSLLCTFDRFGLPDAMLMDHGTTWWSTTSNHGLTWFGVELIKQGIQVIYTGIAHPQTQGKVERFHRSLKAGIKHKGKPERNDQWQTTLDNWRNFYNHQRPHEALGMDFPANHYEPSKKRYNPNPPKWEYPEGAHVQKLNAQGAMSWKGGRFFVCEALAKQWVQIQELGNLLLVKYRNLYVREIDLQYGYTKPIVTKEKVSTMS